MKNEDKCDEHNLKSDYFICLCCVHFSLSKSRLKKKELRHDAMLITSNLLLLWICNGIFHCVSSFRHSFLKKIHKVKVIISWLFFLCALRTMAKMRFFRIYSQKRWNVMRNGNSKRCDQWSQQISSGWGSTTALITFPCSALSVTITLRKCDMRKSTLMWSNAFSRAYQKY